MSEFLIPLLELFSKLLIYLGGAAMLGGFFSWWLMKEQPHLERFIRCYISTGVLLALLAVIVNFYAQVGNFAEAGWTGMIDSAYVAMLWDSPIGLSVVLRVSALGGILCLLLLVLLRSLKLLSFVSESSQKVLVLLLLSLGIVLWVASFSLAGHTTELSVTARFLLGLHVLTALLWLGSLLPLWQACRCVDAQPLQQLMHYFGVIAMSWVPVLLICGVVLAYQLLGSFSALVNTSYGWLLLSKIVLVNVMLAFAAWHKWRVVPQLIDQVAANRLQRSIRWESVVGLSILMVTVLVSTVVGPTVDTHHMVQ